MRSTAGSVRVRVALIAGLALASPAGVAQTHGQLFEEPTTVLPHSTVNSTLVADVDGDGTLDLLTVQTSGASPLFVYFGAGDGTFAPNAPVDVGSTAKTFAVADFDGDGIADVAINRTGQQIEVRLGQGDGTFTTHGTFASWEGNLSPGDFNGDGNVDLAAVADGAVGLLLGQGDGSLVAVFVDTIWAPTAETVADLDGDGFDDLAVALGGGQIEVLLGQPAGLTPDGSYLAGFIPTAVAAADMNGDGLPDLVTASHVEDSVAILLGLGGGSFAPPLLFAANDDPESIVVDDFDGDGDQDVAVLNDVLDPGLVSVLLGDGNGALSEPQPVHGGFTPWRLKSGDFDEDGRLDLLVINAPLPFSLYDSVSVLHGRGDGSFGGNQIFALAKDFPEAIATGDFDLDGLPDLAVIAEGPLLVYLGQGDGTMDLHQMASGGIRDLVAGDFDEDGQLDLATRGGIGVKLLIGQPDGSFASGGNFPTDPYGSEITRMALAVADLNGDAHLDLACANDGNDTLQVLLGNGAGSMSSGTPISIDALPYGVAVADVDEDDDLDLVAATHEGLVVALNDGAGGLTLGGTAGTGMYLRTVVTGDFNGDGLADVAAGELDPSETVIMLGHGDGTFHVYSIGGSASSLVVGDFDGDGVEDLAGPMMGHTAGILRGLGDGSFEPPDMYGVGMTPQDLATADFDRDGTLDLVTMDVGGYLSGPSGTVLLNRQPTAWQSLGQSLAGVDGKPVLIGVGTLAPASSNTLHLTHGKPGGVANFVVGVTLLMAPFKGGTLVPQPLLVVPLPIPPSGQLALPFTWPPAAPSGVSLFMQAWTADAAAVAGFAASNGLALTTP